jgi:hypothetical protein
MLSPIWKNVCVIHYAKQLHAPVFGRPSENGFASSIDTEVTMKTRGAFAKRKAVFALV